MTKEQAILILEELWRYKQINYEEYEIRTALDLGIKALKLCEVWNGIHGQLVAPKGTFNKIWEDVDNKGV